MTKSLDIYAKVIELNKRENARSILFFNFCTFILKFFGHKSHTQFVSESVEIEGLTGDIRFNEDGRRENYTLNIMEMTVDSGMVKVADWSDQLGFVSTVKINDGSDRVQARIDYERNRTYTVTTIIEEPFLMLRKGKPGKVLEGNDLYEGYCKELADLIAQKLGINCTCCRFEFNSYFSEIQFIPFFPFLCVKDVLRTVKDGSYGSENPSEVSGWSGMVGELLRRVG